LHSSFRLVPLMLAATPLLLQSCAGTPRGAASGGAAVIQPGVPGRSALEELARRQTSRPDESAVQTWRELPGIEPDDIAPLAPDQLTPGSPALRALDEVLSSLLAIEPAAEPAAAEVSTDADRLSAQRAYARARAHWQAGETAEALRGFETAVRLDGSSPTLLRALGVAQLRAGRRSAGVTTLRRAEGLGMNDPEALWLLAREESRLSRADEAARLLAKAYAGDEARPGADVASLIALDLAELLLARGHPAAASELLDEALVHAPAAARQQPESIEWARRRPGALLLAGDTRNRLGRPAEAVERYRGAAESDPAGAVKRTVATLLMTGRSAEAALQLLDAGASGSMGSDGWAIEAVRRIGRRTEAGPALARAVADRANALDVRASPATRRELVRLAASCSPPSQARELLGAWLAANKPDPVVVADLLDTLKPGQVRARVEALRAIVSVSPVSAPACVEAAFLTGVDVRETMDVLEGAAAQDGASALLAAAYRLRLNDPRAALRVIEQVDTTASASVREAAALTRAVALAACGDETAAVALLERESRALSPRSLAIGLDAAGNPSGALNALRPSITARTATVDDLLLAGELAVRAHDVAAARAALEQARDADPADERPHRALVSFHSAVGPSPDAAALGESVRRLRRDVPGSVLVRLITAQDAVQRGKPREAAEQFRSMLDDRGQPEDALDALRLLWPSMKPEALQEPEAFVRARAQERPQSHAWSLAHATVLAARGETAAARGVLETLAERLPTEDLLRAREDLVRNVLKNPQEADALALDRLERAPSTFATRLERAEVLLRRAEAAKALESILDGVAGTPRLDPEQVRRVGLLLTRLTPESFDAKREQGEAFIELLETLHERGLPRTPAIGLLRVDVIARAAAADPERVLGEVRTAAGDSREVRRAAIAQAARVLIGLPDPSPALRFLGLAAVRESPPDAQLLREWFVRTAAHGTPEDAAWLVAAVETEEVANVLLSEFLPEHVDASEPTSVIRSQVAYALGNLAGELVRDEVSLAAYRAALGLNPDHPWVGNNLGYLILERGGSLEEAAGLIERAHESLGDEASVIDSLGWVRYKQGNFDEAVALLRQANDLEEGNHEMLEHLGDALWMRNAAPADRAEAVDFWRRAASMLDLELAAVKSIEPVRRGKLDELTARREGVQDRLDAAAANRAPPVSPRGIPAKFTPRPEPPPIDLTPKPAPPGPRGKVFEQ